MNSRTPYVTPSGFLDFIFWSLIIGAVLGVMLLGFLTVTDEQKHGNDPMRTVFAQTAEPADVARREEGATFV